MIPKALGRMLGIASTALLVLAAAPPQAALADEPKVPCCTTVTITDQGFDKTVYNIGIAGGTHDADQGSVTFINKGTIIHGAKTVAGTLDEGVMFAGATDSLGTQRPCWTGGDTGSGNCWDSRPLDTGGIPPNGTVTLGFAPLNIPVDYTFSSPTDCMFGHNTPGFDCTPVKIHISPNETGLSPLSKSMNGSWVFPVGDPVCRTDIPAVTPAIGPAFCYGQYGLPGRILGSSKKPLNGATVNITDFGYDPAVVYVTVGSTVTWVNTGTRVHSVNGSGASGQGPDDYHRIQSPGLAPGESYSYGFNLYSAGSLDTANPSTSYSSSVDLDLLPPNLGTTKENANDWQPSCRLLKGKAGSHKSCGSALMTGKVSVVDPNAP
jgi:hypothetical protein